MGSITLEHVKKSFGTSDIIPDASLEIADKSFVVFVGPSGCGKTTLLRLIAGLEDVTGGKIMIDGMDVTNVPPAKRGLSMVFQSYALYPHMSVRGNIGFGPTSRGRSTAEVKDIVERFVELVGLQKFADAYPHQLSGGMKQRVAIARVLANDAEIVLMDEPFGALDAMTRERLQDELLDIWQRTGLTVLFVTHSIEEAIFLADRVVVMSPGPGRIDSEMKIQLPRPRDVVAADFNDIRRELSLKLHSHLARKAA